MTNNEEQKIQAPPTPEITIRTMKSDLKSIAAGEASPIPEKVSAKELEKIAAGPIKVISEALPVEKSRKKIGLIIAIIAILLGLIALIYFLI